MDSIINVTLAICPSRDSNCMVVWATSLTVSNTEFSHHGDYTSLGKQRGGLWHRTHVFIYYVTYTLFYTLEDRFCPSASLSRCKKKKKVSRFSVLKHIPYIALRLQNAANTYFTKFIKYLWCNEGKCAVTILLNPVWHCHKGPLPHWRQLGGVRWDHPHPRIALENIMNPSSLS